MGIFKKKQPADAVDLVLMRSELDELRERLTAAEQAKASLEDRLSSLAATTMVLSSATKNDTAEIVDQIESIQRRIGESQAVGSKVDELHRRVVDVEQRSTTLAPPSQVEARLAVLDARLNEVAELASAPVAPDEALAARLEHLAVAAASLSSLEGRLAQLDEGLSSVTGQVDGRFHELNATLEERLAALNARVDGSDAEARATRAHSASLDERIAEQAVWATRLIDIDERLAGLQQHLDDLGARSASTDELDAVRVQIDELATAAATVTGPPPFDSTEIDRRVGELAERVALTAEETRAARERADALEARLDAPATDVGASDLLETVSELRASVAGRFDEITARLTTVEDDAAANRNHTAKVEDQLERRLTEQAQRLAEVAAVPDTTSLRDELVAFSTRLDSNELDAQTARAQAAALDDRLESVSTQLTNQLAEIGREIDSLASREATGGRAADESAVVDLRTSQVRLASEQARYEIAFREDLAALAEQVRQLRGRN